MIVNSSIINRYYAGYIASSAAGRTVDKISGSNFQSEERAFFKYSPEDQKNKIISEKADAFKSPREYDQRLRQNAPAVKSQKPAKSFNESQKSDLFSDDENENVVELEETDDYEKVRNSSAGGYYIVINENDNPRMRNKIKSAADLWSERISKTYNSGVRKQPGVLVNLVA
ncbi:MAG: hypothetical protein WC061_00955 [Melioribacteraceae bacterium]